MQTEIAASNSRRPYEWAAVVNWSLSLFLLGLTTARAPFGSGMDRFALGFFSGIVWAVIGGLIVALWKYFKRSPAVGKAEGVDVSKTHDKVLFIAAMVIATFLVGKGLYLETYGSLIDAAILLGLGFGVRAGLHPARWLFAIYAFVTPFLVVSNGGGNAVIWPFIFFYVCRSLISRRNGISVGDTHALQTERQLDENVSMTYHLQGGAPPSDMEPPTSGHQASVDEDHIYARIAEELETGNADKGLWTRLFAGCGGDEKQTKVLYIKQRAERLIAAERTRLAQLEHERAADAEQLERLKRQRDGLAAPELVSAVWNGNWGTASKLLRDGVKPIGTDQDGNSLLDLARKRRDRQMIQLLESYGAP